MADDLTGVRILIVDDEEPFRKLLERNLTREGAQVRGAGSGEEALKLLPDAEPDVAILDVTMPGMSGLDLLTRLREASPETEAIMLTGNASVGTAIDAMKRGAYDYIEKPVKLAELVVLLRKALEKRRLATENASLRESARRREPSSEIVGESRAIRDAVALLTRVAGSGAPVLILGESGTGKELAARAVHRFSSRAAHEMVAVNCAALNENLLEDELFGHKKGAFTSASEDRRGLFELADKGTLFIDEIGEMPLSLQKKLLRVVEYGTFRRVGDERERKVDVRLVAATHRDLEREVAAGTFRQDLFFRLNVLAVRLPPLRERKEDIPRLVEHFLTQRPRRAGERPPAIAPAAIERLARHDWPGNVRELLNILERALIVSSTGAIGPEDIPDLSPRTFAAPAPPAPAAPGSSSGAFAAPQPSRSTGDATPASGPASAPGAPNATLDDLERQHVMDAIARCGGNKTKAAMELGISLRALYRRLEKYGPAP